MLNTVDTRLALPHAFPSRKSIEFFRKSGELSTFFSPKYGFVIAPSKIIMEKPRANKLMALLNEGGLEIGRAYEVEAGQKIILSSIGKDHRTLIFTPVPEEYVLPETLPPSFFDIKGALPRELYYDPIRVGKENSWQISQIQIDDENLKRFVEQKSKEISVYDPELSYVLIYHDYREEGKEEVKAKADGLALVRNVKSNLTRKETTYVFLYKTPGSTISKLPLGMILRRKCPKHVISSNENISVSEKLYKGIYIETETEKINMQGLNLEALKTIWPFPLPSHPEVILELKEPVLTTAQRRALFKDAAKKNNVFGMAAAGHLMQSAGKGLLEGACLYSILDMASDLKVGSQYKAVAILGVLGKLSTLFYMRGHRLGSKELYDSDNNKRMGEFQNALYPMFDLGLMHVITQDLIARYKKVSASYFLASVVYFHLFPDIFKSIWSAADAKILPFIFLAGYLGTEYLLTQTDAYESLNNLKIAENQLRFNSRTDEFKETFWVIKAYLDNLAMKVNQIFLLVGAGLYSLTANFLSAYKSITAISLGAIALLLNSLRFLLPIFGREENTRLEIKFSEFLRLGRRLAFSENVSLKVGNDPKNDVIPNEKKRKVIIPDFEKTDIRPIIKNIASISTKTNWVSKLVPFAFAQKHSIIVRTKNASDPKVVFKFYGVKEPPGEEEIRKQYIIEV